MIALSPVSVVAQTAGRPLDRQNIAPPDLAAAMAQYRRALEAYNRAQQAYAAEAGAYWSAIAEKRHMRWHKRAANEPISIDDYVLTQPPVYTGPPRPRDPSKPRTSRGIKSTCRSSPISSRRRSGNSSSCRACRRAKASSSAPMPRSRSAAGLTRDQVLRIYSFEATGNGRYDVQAGLEFSKRGPAITTALGYNQLLATNTVEIMAESGRHIIDDLAGQGGAIARRRQAGACAARSAFCAA